MKRNQCDAIRCSLCVVRERERERTDSNTTRNIYWRWRSLNVNFVSSLIFRRWFLYRNFKFLQHWYNAVFAWFCFKKQWHPLGLFRLSSGKNTLVGPIICACQRSRNKVACGEYTRFINFSATSAEGTCNRFDPHPRPTDPFVSHVPTVPVPKRST